MASRERRWLVERKRYVASSSIRTFPCTGLAGQSSNFSFCHRLRLLRRWRAGLILPSLSTLLRLRFRNDLRGLREMNSWPIPCATECVTDYAVRGMESGLGSFHQPVVQKNSGLLIRENHPESWGRWSIDWFSVFAAILAVRPASS